MACPFCRGQSGRSRGTRFPPALKGAAPCDPPPGNGGQIRCGTAGTDAALSAVAEMADIARRNEACDRQRASAFCNTVSSQLYGVSPTNEEVYVPCCDPCNGCKEYRLRERSTFWPAFAHPRWLRCDELYHGNNG